MITTEAELRALLAGEQVRATMADYKLETPTPTPRTLAARLAAKRKRERAAALARLHSLRA